MVTDLFVKNSHWMLCFEVELRVVNIVETLLFLRLMPLPFQWLRYPLDRDCLTHGMYVTMSNAICVSTV